MLKHKKLGGLTAVVALVAAMMAGLFFYSGTGTASADEPSCTINECDNSVTPPSREVLLEALQTERNGAYFWTGRVNNQSVEADALRIANESGGNTLEGALSDGEIVMPVFADRTDEAVAAWTLASQIFAEQARGDVFVVMGDELREGNIFQSEELPRLRDNPNVQRVIRMNTSGQEVEVLFDRNADTDPGDDEGDGNDEGSGDDEDDEAEAFSIVAQEDESLCVDTAEGENGGQLGLKKCNGTARQDFSLDGEQKLRALISPDLDLCLTMQKNDTGPVDFPVVLVACDEAPTWRFIANESWQNDDNGFQLSTPGNKTEEDLPIVGNFVFGSEGAPTVPWTNVE